MSDTTLSAGLSNMTAGENISETVAFDSYKASDGWTCKYAFRGMSAFEIAADTNADNDSFDLKYTWAESEKLPPGIYGYTGYVEKNADRIAVDKGTIEIFANPGLETYAQKVLAAIRAVVLGRATSDQLTISLGNVQLQYMTPEQLTEMETSYLARVRNEIASLSVNRAGPQLGMISTRFTGR